MSTVYSRAFNPRVSRCEIIDGFLTKARSRADRGQTADRWDAGFSTRSGAPWNAAAPNLSPIDSDFEPYPGQENPPRRLESQFIHGATPEGGLYLRGERLPTSGYDPFWNVRAHTSTITEHGGYASYQFWCAINQLVLDDIAATGASQ